MTKLVLLKVLQRVEIAQAYLSNMAQWYIAGVECRGIGKT